MKILIATNHSFMLWKFRKELIDNLIENNEIVLSMPFAGHEKDFEKMGCKCIDTKINRRGINPFKDFKLFRFYNKIIKNEKPDLVITYSIKPNIYLGYICRKKKIEYCVNVQGLGTAFQKKVLSSIVTKMYKIGIKKAKVVFFENESNYELFLKRKICGNNGVVLMGAGVNLDYYNQEPYPNNGPIHFLYLGRIMKEKGIDELLYSVEKIKDEYGNSVIFDFVGPLEDEYKTVLTDYCERGLINYLGFQDETRPFYKTTNCLIMPSYHEGLSNVLLEASSTGRPIITTNIPGCKEVVEDKVTGFLCDAKNADSLYFCIKAFLDLPYESKCKMGELARKKVESVFDKKAIVNKTIYHLFASSNRGGNE